MISSHLIISSGHVISSSRLISYVHPIYIACLCRRVAVFCWLSLGVDVWSFGGCLESILGRFGGSEGCLERSFGGLEGSWTALGRSWVALGPLLACLGWLLARLVPLLERSRACLGAVLGALGGVLGCSWRDLGAPKSMFQRSWLQNIKFENTLKHMWKNTDVCRSWEARIALGSS